MRKQYLVVLLMGLLLSACLTDKKIARNCNRFLEVCGVPQNETTLKDTTVNIDQMVVIPISPDSVKWDGEVSVKNGLAQLPPVEIRGKVISTTFSIVGGRLQVSSRLHKTELPVRLYATITLPGAIRETSVTRVVEKTVIPQVYKISFWIIVAQIALVLILLAGKTNPFLFIKNLLKIN